MHWALILKRMLYTTSKRGKNQTIKLTTIDVFHNKIQSGSSPFGLSILCKAEPNLTMYSFHLIWDTGLNIFFIFKEDS